MTRIDASYGSGANTSDMDVYAQNIYRMFIEKKADERLVGSAGVVLQDVDVLDLLIDRPDSAVIEPVEITEGSLADAQRIGFFKDFTTQRKYHSRIMIEDETKARDLQGITMTTQMNAQIKGLAIKKDKEIFETLSSGAGTSLGATGAWNDSDSADIFKDFGKVEDYIIDNTESSDADLKDMVVFYPGKLKGYMQTPTQIDNVRTTPMKYIEEEMGGKWIWTRRLTNTAIFVIPSEETAVTYNYTGEAIPRYEYDRIKGRGDEHNFFHMWRTKIIPESSGAITNDRIVKMTGVYV